MSSEQNPAALAEVTPPGYEHVVKGLKKNENVDNPWAVAWWMKGQGIRPHKAKAAKGKSSKSSETDDVPTVSGTMIAHEAMPVTGVAALMRPAQMTAGQLQGSPAPVVPNTSVAFPIQSFRDDVKRKEGIFASMHPSMGLQPKDVVNYRYADDPKKACGVCAHYSPDGACEKVIGMIRAVDTCDLWEQKTAQSDAMKALTQRLQQQQAPPPSPLAPAGPPAVPTVRANVISTESEDQPRDESGKFASAGGGTAASAAPKPPPRIPTRAERKARMKSRAKAALQHRRDNPGIYPEQAQKDFAMARGRQQQKVIRAIRARKD